MANGYTRMQLPSNISDQVILRRVLEDIILAVDRLEGNRGGEKLGSQEDVLGNFNSIRELRANINQLAQQYLKVDGSIEARGLLTYSDLFEPTNDLHIPTKKYVDDLYRPQVSPLTMTQLISATPTKIEVEAIQDKLNELINSLKDTLILT